MSNQAKLRVIFDRYNISPKATKNFINYFMSHAKLRVCIDTSGADTVNVTECNGHEDDNYKFIISSAVPTNDDGDSNEPIVSDVCVVSGNMSNSATGESVKFNDNIFKLDKVDNNYELNIKSKQEFDVFNLAIKLVPKHNETYAAIVQDNYSHVAGYNFQIPIQTDDNYSRGSAKLWHASVDSIDRDVAIGMNFCQVLIEDIKDDDEVMLKLVNATNPDDTAAQIRIEIYLNGVLYAKTYNSQKTNKLNEDNIWPANILMPTFNQRGKNGFKMQLGDHVFTDDVYLCDFIKMYNYDGEAGYLWLNLKDKSEVDIPMQQVTDYLLTHYKESVLAARLSNKEVNSKLLAFKTVYEYDRDNRYMDTSDSNFNIPVSLKVIPTSGAPLDNDILPYFNSVDEYDKTSSFGDIKFELPKPKDKVEYSLKTRVFTINYTRDGEDKTINAYYKLGICALDGSDYSSEKLLNSFIKKCYLTAHYRDYALGIQQKLTFAIKPRSMEEHTFYSVSEKFQFLDRASAITDRNNLICNTALRPIVEINTADQSKNRLLGVLYMDMFNADDDSIIDAGLHKNNDKNISIMIDDEPVLDKEDKEIEITKI